VVSFLQQTLHLNTGCVKWRGHFFTAFLRSFLVVVDDEIRKLSREITAANH